MRYTECLDKAGHEWLRIVHQNMVFYMEYDISDIEEAEEEENDLVYNYYMYKKIGQGKVSRGMLGKDGRGVEEYDGGLLETCSKHYKTPKEIDRFLAETALFPKLELEITRIPEPDWAR